MDDIVLGQLIVLAHKIQETILKDSSKIRGKIMQEVRGPSTVERVRLRKAEVIAVTSRLQGPSRNMVFTCYIDHCKSLKYTKYRYLYPTLVEMINEQ